MQVAGHTAGIVVRDQGNETLASLRRFNALGGMQFVEPYAAERAARQLLPRHIICTAEK